MRFVTYKLLLINWHRPDGNRSVRLIQCFTRLFHYSRLLSPSQAARESLGSLAIFVFSCLLRYIPSSSTGLNVFCLVQTFYSTALSQVWTARYCTGPMIPQVQTAQYTAWAPVSSSQIYTALVIFMVCVIICVCVHISVALDNNIWLVVSDGRHIVYVR